jgi:hypothetical protein
VATHIIASPSGWADLSKFKQATDSNMSLVSAGTTAPTRTLLSVPVLVSNSMTDGTMLVLDKSTILRVYGSVQLATSTVYYFGSDHATAGGNRPRSAIACGRCDRWWTGRSEAHCSACHETFTCIGAFDWHRRNGQCRKPQTSAWWWPTGVWFGWSQPGTWRGPDDADVYRDLFA